MCSAPVLKQPNFAKKFYLQTDASAYSIGTILSQEGELETPSLTKHSKPTLHPIAYYSATFTPMERNYDIYERELLSVMKALAPPTLPSPPSLGAWCTISKSGKISYAGTTAAAHPPQATTPSPQPPQTATKPIITIAQAFQTLTTDTLNAMTKDQIIGAFQMRFGSCLPQRLTKMALIQCYIARSQATATSHPQPQPPANDKPKVIQLTEITVIWDSSAVSLSQTRELADASVRQLQQELHRARALNEKSPLSLISGQWSAQNSPNFVLIFAGQLELDLIMKY